MKGDKLFLLAKNLLNQLYDKEIIENKQKQKQLYFDYLKLIQKSAYSDNVEAQYELAGHYDDMGYWGNPNPYYNSKKCFYWHTKAAENNHAAACNNLANYYLCGDVVEKNISKALALYKKSLALDKVSYVKENYYGLIKEINSSVFAKVLLQITGDAVVSELLKNKTSLLTNWEVDSEGYIIKLISYESKNGFPTAYLSKTEEYLKTTKARLTLLKAKKQVIKIDFPQTLMKLYQRNKNRESGEISPLEYLKGRIQLFYFLPD